MDFTSKGDRDRYLAKVVEKEKELNREILLSSMVAKNSAIEQIILTSTSLEEMKDNLIMELYGVDVKGVETIENFAKR